MAWAAIVAADVQTVLSGPELTALQSSALASGQVDPLPGVITQVTDEIRGYIAVRGETALGPAGTLPAQVKSAAIAMARWRLGGRIPGQAGAIFQNENRKKDYEDAQTLLKAIAEGKFVVEKPTTVGPEPMTVITKSGTETKLDFSTL